MTISAPCPRCDSRGYLDWWDFDVLPMGDERVDCHVCNGTGEAHFDERIGMQR